MRFHPLRLAVRLPAFAIVTGAAFVVHVACVPLLRVVGARRRAARWSSTLFRVWARLVARILRARIRVRGRPPEPPFLLVSNHLGYMDLVLFASHVDCVFVARSDVARWPVFGPMCRSVGTIFVDRRARWEIPGVIDRIEQVMDHGRGVVIFPEGTSTGGSEVLGFRPSLLEAAIRTRVPVSCASVTYRTPASARSAHLAVCWWGSTGFVPHLLGLFDLPGFVGRVSFAAETVSESDRKLLAVKSREAVLRQFRAVPRPYRSRTGPISAGQPVRPP